MPPPDAQIRNINRRLRSLQGKTEQTQKVCTSEWQATHSSSRRNMSAVRLPLPGDAFIPSHLPLSRSPFHVFQGVCSCLQGRICPYCAKAVGVQAQGGQAYRTFLSIKGLSMDTEGTPPVC
eukprot:scaffold323691_cov22-Tisochrysis_lutea.AAC.1